MVENGALQKLRLMMRKNIAPTKLISISVTALNWWALIHFAVEIIVLLLAAIGYGLTGGARNLLETYISGLWAIPVFFGLPPISGPIFVLSLPALIWLLLWTSGARDTLIPWR